MCALKKPLPSTPVREGRVLSSKDLKKTPKGSSATERLLGQLRLGRALSEKCELLEAKNVFEAVWQESRTGTNLAVRVEAITGLIRLAAEALDESEIQRFEDELNPMIAKYPGALPPMVWFCKGVLASRLRRDAVTAYRDFKRFLHVSRDPQTSEKHFQVVSREDCIGRAWGVIAMTLNDQGRSRRAEWVARAALARFESKNLKLLNSQFYHLLGRIYERRRDYETALSWYRQAQSSVLTERNWYFYCYVLLSYAVVARLQRNYPVAYQYLDMVSKVASGPEFGSLRRAIQTERTRLEQDAVDLLIDSRRGLVETREGGSISLRKQYVLLGILEALSSAHDDLTGENARGLSKAEIIEKVWHEAYRPEAHDNKLYYNINRLRKLIEPDTKKPQYLLNWREGYRLAPGLKVRHLSITEGARKANGGN